jgi:amino acid transporter
MTILRKPGGGKAGGTVGAPVVLGAALASVAPLLVEGGVVTGAMANGLSWLPWVFAGVAVVLLLFMPGFVAMTERTGTGGGLASIVTAGLGPAVGAVAWYVALVAYGLLQVALYGLAGTQFASFFAQYGHLHHPWWVWALLAWALVTVASGFKLKWIGIVLITFTAGEIIVSILLSVSALTTTRDAPHALVAGHMSLSLISAAIPVCVLGQVGFETTALYKREVAHPRRTISRATIAALLTPALLFIAASWAIVAHDGSQAAALAAAQGPGAYFGIGSHAESVTANILLNTSLLGGLIGYNQAWIRYAYNGAAVGMMPPLFSRTNARAIHTPLTVLQAACGLAAIGLTCWRGWDPFAQFFYVGGTLGGYGVLLLYVLASVSVTVYFRRDTRGESARVARVYPVAASLLLLAMTVMASWHFALMIGVSPSDPMAKALPLTYALVALIGLSWALRTRREAPEKYAELSGPPVPKPVPPTDTIAQETGA